MTWVRGLLIVLAVIAALVVTWLMLPPRWAACLLYGVLILLGLVVALLLLFPFSIEIHFKREGKDDRIHIGVRGMAGLVRLGYDIPVAAIMERSGKITLKKDPAKQMPKRQKGWVTITVEKIEKIMREIRKIRKRLRKYKRAVRRFTRTFELQKFEWRTAYGTGDAAETAYIAGLVWGVKGVIAGLSYRYFNVKKRMQYDVRPHFQAKGFRTELTCIIRFWLGKAMVAGLTLVFLWLREGIKWRNIRFKA